jgi:DNA primase
MLWFTLADAGNAIATCGTSLTEGHVIISALLQTRDFVS